MIQTLLSFQPGSYTILPVSCSHNLLPLTLYLSLSSYLFCSCAGMEDGSALDVYLTPASPTSNRTQTTSPISPTPSSGRDHSPHPHRRMSIPSEVSCSDPDLARSSRASRNDVARRSLRVSRGRDRETNKLTNL